jgi:hypothetical protein
MTSAHYQKAALPNGASIVAQRISLNLLVRWPPPERADESSRPELYL